jgi:branched-chain amino acid transport system substrate-binding protein
MIGRDDVQGKIAAERIATLYFDKKLAFIYFPGSYSEDLALTSKAALEVLGVKPAITIKEVASAASYAGGIQDLIDAKIEVLYLAGGGLDSGVFMRQLRQMGAQCQVISSDTLVSKVFIEAAGAAGEGVPFTFPPEPAKLSTSTKAVAAIKEMGLEPVGYTLLAYAATQTWIEGVRRANSFDAALVATAIRRGPMETILGAISFDEKGDINTPYPAFAWYMWKDGKRVALD